MGDGKDLQKGDGKKMMIKGYGKRKRALHYCLRSTFILFLHQSSSSLFYKSDHILAIFALFLIGLMIFCYYSISREERYEKEKREDEEGSFKKKRSLVMDSRG